MVAGIVNDEIMRMLSSKRVDIMFIVKSEENQIVNVNGQVPCEAGSDEGNVFNADIEKGQGRH